MPINERGLDAAMGEFLHPQQFGHFRAKFIRMLEIYEAAKAPAKEQPVDCREAFEAWGLKNGSRCWSPTEEYTAWAAYQAAWNSRPSREAQQFGDCKEAYEIWLRSVPSDQDPDWEVVWYAAWDARPTERESGCPWLPIDDAAKKGQTVILGGYVCGEWMVTQDDWYSDRVMSDWREWPGLFDEPPTHYMAFPKPPELALSEIEGVSPEERK